MHMYALISTRAFALSKECSGATHHLTAFQLCLLRCRDIYDDFADIPGGLIGRLLDLSFGISTIVDRSGSMFKFALKSMCRFSCL